MFDHIKIILVNTTHPGNIGAVARAMKNMGFKHLCLVSPKVFPSEEANARSAGAEDILSQATVVSHLDEALADCHWAFGLSARARKIALPTLMVRAAAEKIASSLFQAPKTPVLKVGLVFGQEQSGLLNEELTKCHYQIRIPASPDYASLNLGQAVQIVSYELRMALLNLRPTAEVEKPEADPLATIAEIESFYQHLSNILIQIRFLDPKMPKHLMQHLRRLYNKSQLTKIELNILQGILTATEKSIKD